MNSIWVTDAGLPTFSQLGKSIQTDVLIIGGGIAGVLCAYTLSQAGVECVLVEAKALCSGVTRNTTAKITLQHGLLYSKLIRRMGKENAALFFRAQQAACHRYAELCGDLDCDYTCADSYVYSMDDTEKIKQETAALKLLGADTAFCRETELPFPTAGAVCVKNQAHFHPLKFIRAIANNLPVYEHTKVLELMPGRATTHHGEIRCKKIIIATHFPMDNKHGAYFAKLYQHRSYVLSLEGAEPLHGMYVDEKDTGLSFRTYCDRLLLGGGGHRTGKKGGAWQELERFSRKYYPSARITARWATQDCISLDGVPYIGLYSRTTPDLYVATGFNKWGMTSSMVAATLLADLVQGKKNPCAHLFSPSRRMYKPQLVSNLWESTVGLLTPTVPRCPHLGCALKYNPAEHSWDCPCHGSRFDSHSKLLDNPATDDKKGL